MKRFLIAAVTCLALTVGVTPAMAGSGLGGVTGTLLGTSQQNTNTAGDASASNENGTWQSNEGSQQGYGGDASTGDATTGAAGCCASAGDATSGDASGGDATQTQDATNSNSTTQDASAESKAVQILPVNVAVPVCLAVSCKSGGVEQSNTSSSGNARAGNQNETGQSNEQSQKGVGGDASTGHAKGGGYGDATSGEASGGDVTQSQTASNSNSTTQNASAESKAVQILPVNVAVPVCIAKHCETGDVRQSNANRSGDVSASNENRTWQSNAQSQQGFGGNAESGDATTGKGGCCTSAGDATSGDAYGGDVTQSQSASSSNDTSQNASAESKAKQIAPANVSGASPARQSNANSSGDAWAGNRNHTGQSNEQSQTGVGGNASTGDATATGGCCTPAKHPERQCKPHYGRGKGHCKPTPEKRACDKPEHRGDAVSGVANGGDVDQHQQASNDNRTTQTASATSKAVQKAPLNLVVRPTWPKPAPAPCKTHEPCKPEPVPCRPKPC
jgi:hypothetical protein